MSLISNASAQNSFFSPTLSDYRSSGWSLSIGGSGLGGSNSPFNEDWLIANSTSGTIDTVYSGTWTPQGGFHLAGGIGRVFIAKNPILADRFSINLIGSRRTITETFEGVIDGQDSVVVGSGSALNIGVFVDALRTITLTKKVFLEVGIGGGYRIDFSSKFDFETSTPLSVLEGEMSPFSGCFEFIMGGGLKMKRGKFIRLQFAADMLQLAPINSTAKLPWRVGDYRPYRAMISCDLFGLKPIKSEGSCAAPTHSDKSKELFGKKMRGWGRAKNKRNKED
ncbi:MAG: hypothetical protein HOM41_05620 [Flavobacteriales bacterium]|nr:hypothetical protein [Flavobacteriales bacterium]